MACPFFYPLVRLDSSGWAVPPRLPLGDAFNGECRASAEAFQPDEAQTREVCNVGYGRGQCGRFPAEAANDAIRFHLSEDSGALIRIQYVFEKDCWPLQHGVFEWHGAAVSSGPEDGILRRQATAFVESYLRRRG